MNHLRSVLPLLAGLMVLGALPANAAQALRVSCTQSGRIVNREDLPINASDEVKYLVTAHFPEALCIFVKVDDSGDNGRIVVRDPPNPVTAPIGTPVSADADLATALSMISAGSSGPASGSAAPVDLTEAMKPFRSQAPTDGDQDNHTVNLTIGIYENVQPGDVLAHWRLMQDNTVMLRRLTPTLTRTKDITMLSVENIPDNEAGTVCEEAGKLGSGCLAYY